MRYIVDTNVLMVACGAATHVSHDCQIACLKKLMEIVTMHVLVIDDQGLMIDEYKHALRSVPKDSFRDAFLIHIYDNMGNPDKVHCVTITQCEHAQDFVEFPRDGALAHFDNDDRKFVAAAIADANQSTILQGSDIVEWTAHEQNLAKHGVSVDFLCGKDSASSVRSPTVRGSSKKKTRTRRSLRR